MAAAIVNSSIPSSEEFLCDPLPSWGIGVGVAMGVAGSIGINIGQNVQAMGIKTLDPSDYTSPWKSKLWRIGLCIFITFALINFAALSLAPASILCPIESIQFVTNVVWNAVVNKIRINGKMKFGVVCAIIGTVLTVTFGAPGGCHSPAMLVTYWQSLTWWIYLMITLSVAAAAFTVHRRYRKLDQEGTPPPHPALLPVCYSLYCALVGGAQLIVHSKMISVLLSVITEDPAAVFTSWLFYVELLLVCVCGITWGIKLTECLALYDPLIIIPLMVGFYISFGGVAGGIFFQVLAALLLPRPPPLLTLPRPLPSSSSLGLPSSPSLGLPSSSSLGLPSSPCLGLPSSPSLGCFRSPGVREAARGVALDRLRRLGPLPGRHGDGHRRPRHHSDREHRPRGQGCADRRLPRARGLRRARVA